MSLPEVLLWQRLKGSPNGIAFRKQHPIGPYRADFYCASAKAVIEVDGEAHNRADRPARDIDRDRYLRERGYCVAHISAVDILQNADEAAMSIISLTANPLHQPAAGPPPRERGGCAA